MVVVTNLWYSHTYSFVAQGPFTEFVGALQKMGGIRLQARRAEYIQKQMASEHDLCRFCTPFSGTDISGRDAVDVGRLKQVGAAKGW